MDVGTRAGHAYIILGVLPPLRPSAYPGGRPPRKDKECMFPWWPLGVNCCSHYSHWLFASSPPMQGCRHGHLRGHGHAAHNEVVEVAHPKEGRLSQGFAGPVDPP
jgi:hypothetical protein